MTELEFLQAFQSYLIQNKNNIPKKNDFENYLLKFSIDFIDYYNQFSYDFQLNGEFELLSKLSRQNFKIIFDVGANIGDWSTKARELFPGAKIHAFELSKKTYETLSEKVKFEEVILNNFGLSDQIDETVQYKDYGKDSGLNTLVIDANFHDHYLHHEIVESKVTTGDDYCLRNDIQYIDFLKIDVEGAESQVLNGFNGMLEKQGVRFIQFEYGYTNGDAKFLMKDFFRFFDRFGYKVAKIKRGGIDFSPWKYSNNDFKSGPNYAAVRATDTELINLLW
jgi:FkbM family methyltransferase